MEIVPDEVWAERFREVGLGEYAKPLLDLRRPGVRLVTEAGDEQEMPLGSSRLGGRPDLPEDFEWPVFRGAPLGFVGQINLSQVSPLEADGALPGSGLLTFFYDIGVEQVWGFSPEDRGGCAVVFTESSVPLSRREFPDDMPEHSQFGAARVSARSELVWASWESHDVDQLLNTIEECTAYGMATGQELAFLGEDVEFVDNDPGPRHRLLGNPDLVQGDIQEQCQLVTHGIDCGGADYYSDPRTAGLLPGAGDWRLLLQIDTDDGIDMMWGDVGRIYFSMHKDMLAQRAWDQAWAVLQCS